MLLGTTGLLLYLGSLLVDHAAWSQRDADVTAALRYAVPTIPAVGTEFHVGLLYLCFASGY